MIGATGGDRDQARRSMATQRRLRVENAGVITVDWCGVKGGRRWAELQGTGVEHGERDEDAVMDWEHRRRHRGGQKSSGGVLAWVMAEMTARAEVWIAGEDSKLAAAAWAGDEESSSWELQMAVTTPAELGLMCPAINHVFVNCLRN